MHAFGAKTKMWPKNDSAITPKSNHQNAQITSLTLTIKKNIQSITNHHKKKRKDKNNNQKTTYNNQLNQGCGFQLFRMRYHTKQSQSMRENKITHSEYPVTKTMKIIKYQKKQKKNKTRKCNQTQTINNQMLYNK